MMSFFEDPQTLTYDIIAIQESCKNLDFSAIFISIEMFFILSICNTYLHEYIVTSTNNELSHHGIQSIIANTYAPYN